MKLSNLNKVNKLVEQRNDKLYELEYWTRNKKAFEFQGKGKEAEENIDHFSKELEKVNNELLLLGLDVEE
jgi:hypothetical protein